MIDLRITLDTRLASDSSITYGGQLFYFEDVPCGDCRCDDSCGDRATVEVGKPIQDKGDVRTLLSAAHHEAKAQGFEPESKWELDEGNTFTCKARPPLPKALNKNTVLSVLRDLGLDVSDSGSVAFTFSSGRATVVRKLYEAPYRIDIKGKL